MVGEVYYYFCENCGGDTASYDTSIKCPYCHTSGEHVKRIGVAATRDHQSDITAKLNEMRSAWMAAHPSAVLGSSSARQRGAKWFRRK
ncbi:MAG: hypothetical protein K6T83_14665 [Alicyclobacillus sp.]|nr:hypothetical protein [Alicyclobacillus sp.]